MHFTPRVPICALLVLTLSSLAVAQRYTITDLGTLPEGDFSEGFGVNIFGHVAGCSDTTNQCVSNISGDAFVWTDQKGMQRLQRLPGGHSTLATAINDSDQVVGQAFIPGPVDTHAVLWDEDKKIKDLGTLTNGAFSSAR